MHIWQGLRSDGRISQMGKVYDIEKEKISEQSKKEICEACKEMAKTYLDFTEEQLKEFEKNFYIVSIQICIWSEKRKNENLKEHLHSAKDV